mgnify:CR=1 FL=1
MVIGPAGDIYPSGVISASRDIRPVAVIVRQLRAKNQEHRSFPSNPCITLEPSDPALFLPPLEHRLPFFQKGRLPFLEVRTLQGCLHKFFGFGLLLCIQTIRG